MGYSAPGAGSLQGTICTQPSRAIITCNTRVSARSSLFYFLLFYRCVTLTVLSENRLPATDYPTHPQRKVGEASLQWQVLICGLNSPLNWAMLLLLTISCGNPRKNLPLRRVTFPHVTSSPFFLLISLRFWAIHTNPSSQTLIMEILQTPKMSQSFLLQLFFL